MRIFEPVKDGNYVAVITPRPAILRSITIENSPTKKGGVTISGITLETTEKADISGALSLPPGAPSPQFDRFIREKVGACHYTPGPFHAPAQRVQRSVQRKAPCKCIDSAQWRLLVGQIHDRNWAGCRDYTIMEVTR